MASLSIILPTYRPGNYLIPCLESIAAQTYTDFELLIVLNGCNEPYYSQIKELLKKYELISKSKLIQTDKPGVSNARNIGIENSIGEYLVFIDDDDHVSPQYLMGLIKVSSENSVAVSNVIEIKNNIKINDYPPSTTYQDLKNNGHQNLFRSRRVLNSPWMKLYPRKIIGTTRFNTNLSLGEDALFNFELSCNIKNLVASDEDAIYFYNLREGSSWTNLSNKKLFLHFNRLLFKLTRIYFSKPFKYNLVYYISRIVAITISFFFPLIKRLVKK